MPKTNRSREHRIDQEIIVDAYTPEERALGWYYYAKSKLRFPCKAKCVAVDKASPLKKGENVELVRLAPEDHCMDRLRVLIRFAGRQVVVPLEQLALIGAEAEEVEVVDDWRYWTSRGYTY